MYVTQPQRATRVAKEQQQSSSSREHFPARVPGQTSGKGRIGLTRLWVGSGTNSRVACEGAWGVPEAIERAALIAFAPPMALFMRMREASYLRKRALVTEMLCQKVLFFLLQFCIFLSPRKLKITRPSYSKKTSLFLIHPSSNPLSFCSNHRR